MLTLTDCLTRLLPLIDGIDDDDPAAADQLINELVASHQGRRERCGVLLALEGALTRESEHLSGASQRLAFGLIERVDAERRRQSETQAEGDERSRPDLERSSERHSKRP